MPPFNIKQDGVQLGSNGFNIVLKQMVNNQWRAVKWLKTNYPPNLVQTQHESLLQLKHENLVSFIGLCRDQDQPGLVYEFMDLSLFEYLDDASIQSLERLDLDWKLSWSLQISRGLSYLHSMAVIHRDLKPSNILLSQDLQCAKISDYGLSKLKALANVTGEQSDLLYKAPELNEGKKHTFQSDIYALGLIIYEIYTAELIDVLVEDQDLENALNNPALHGIIKQCLHACRKHRPACQSVVATLEILESELNQSV
ncbi:kinase-like domain-containing protein [Gorgonomyces haynaldii]|nr:kinase-like domain-containing protein [Gorgonomyces haynaldii]